VDAEDRPTRTSVFTDEQIAAALRQAEGGTPVIDVCRRLGVTETTFYRWRKKYQGVSSVELRERRPHREEGLGLVRRRPARRESAATRRARTPPTAPDERWAMDFMADALADGTRVRVFTRIDLYTRECLALEVRPRFTGADVARRPDARRARARPAAATVSAGGMDGAHRTSGRLVRRPCASPARCLTDRFQRGPHEGAPTAACPPSGPTSGLA
jgi:transposase-like protein